jgi:hypothetical protein
MTYCQHLSTLKLRSIVCLSLVATLCFATNSLQAGRITAWNWFSGIASVARDPIPVLADPNNDDVVGTSPNGLLVTQKDYFAIGPVDFEFTVVPSGGVTEYTIYEGVSNSTGVPWSAYRLELGFGVEASFTPSPSGDGLDFDATDFNSPPDFSGSGFFTTVTESEDVLLASGGVFPVGGFPVPLYRFNIDVPDGISAFTIRQIPIPVPEPGMMTLVFLSGLAFIRRHRLRQEAVVGHGGERG